MNFSLQKCVLVSETRNTSKANEWFCKVNKMNGVPLPLVVTTYCKRDKILVNIQ
jgi:hypothetical protein